jgi:hypothetical protein
MKPETMCQEVLRKRVYFKAKEFLRGVYQGYPAEMEGMFKGQGKT